MIEFSVAVSLSSSRLIADIMEYAGSLKAGTGEKIGLLLQGGLVLTKNVRSEA